ncbi:hypothetical protein [Tissierella sp.]|uniref:hypothetical protein n=1 Tax=Tissierella sp. TaxID=41274 RepID=UPI00307189E2
MAKYKYNKYSIAPIYGTTPTEQTKVLLNYDSYRKPLVYNAVYYPSYTITSSAGIQGYGAYKQCYPGDIPQVGMYVVATTTAYKVRSETIETNDLNGKLATFHYVDILSINMVGERKGSFIEEIVAEDGTYPNDGKLGSYWYVKGGLANTPPTISGQDSNLGDRNTDFTVTYSVNDTDAADNLTVKEKINGVTIKTLNNAPRNQEFTIEITEEMLYSYDLHATNTIEIEVNDGQGNVVYRRYTFKRTNTAPKISGADADLGEKIEGFDITFSATDQENDTMSAKVYLNDRLVKTYEVIEPNQEYIYSLSKLDFVQLNNTDVHKIRIEVQDHNNATAIRNYTFTRKLNRIMYAFQKETDIMATQILISPTWHIAAGAIAQVLVCNNAFDEIPTWENATEQVLLERHFNFINKEKTDEKWGIGVQIIINKGTATELSYLAGFGGAYK